MRISDLIRMSASNLWRRKMRTILTVLGVVIGTASIIVMVSIGIGQNRSLMAAIEESGSLTAIQVYNWGGSSNGTEELLLNDSMLEDFAAMEHVKSVTPSLRFSVVMKQGAYINTYASINGVTQEILDKIPLAEGRLPDKDADSLEFVVGSMVARDFYNEKTQKSYWETQVIPDIDFVNQPIFTVFDRDAYWNSQNGQGDPPKKYLLQASGITTGGEGDYNEYCWEIYCHIEENFPK